VYRINPRCCFSLSLVSGALSCGDCNPLRDTFAVQRPSSEVGTATTFDPEVTDPGGGGGGSGGGADGSGVELRYSEETGTQIVQLCPSLPDRSFLSSDSDNPPSVVADRRPGPGTPGGSVSSGSVPPDAGCCLEETTGDDPDDPDQHTLSSAPLWAELTPEPTPEPTPDHLRAFTVLAVNGSVWIPRWANITPQACSRTSNTTV